MDGQRSQFQWQSRRRRPEHHPDVVAVGNVVQQVDSTADVGTSPDSEFDEGQVVGQLAFSEAFGVDSVPSNELGGLAGKRVGLVLVVSASGLVEQLSDSLDEHRIRL